MIRRMARENVLWGEERIANELLLKLGVRISPRTVRKYLPKRPPGRPRGDLRWSTFLRSHARGILACAYDHKSDGMYPLMTNDRNLSAAQVLTAHKGQPRIEKRFEQLKSVHEIAPVFLKNEARIAALVTLYFLALLVQALIERELPQGMKASNIEQLPLYPDVRACRRPTTEHILRLFSLAERV